MAHAILFTWTERTALNDKYAPRFQRVADARKKFSREEVRRRTVLDRVGQVEDDYIPTVVTSFEVIRRVSNLHPAAGIKERSVVHFREERAARLQNITINVDHYHLCHRFPLQNFSYGRSFAAAQYES